MEFHDIARGLATFTGILRRFHLQADKAGVLIIDDYAHHPTEVQATLQAARSGWPDRRLIAAFQPHLYSRTRQFHQEFAATLQNSDVLFITDVYPSRETPIPGITGQLVAEGARALGHQDVRYVPDPLLLPELLQKESAPGDLIITLGAGDIHRAGLRLAELLPGQG